MPLITFDEMYNVHIPSIDEQHKELMDLINDLNEENAEGKPRAELQKVLGELSQKIEAHFKHEEELFDRTGFPLSDEHKKEHESFRQHFTALLKEYEYGADEKVSDKLISFLHDWFTNHIKEFDQKYSEHFKEHGVA